MARPAGPNEATEIARALGLEPETVRAIDIHMTCDDIITIDVQHIFTAEQGDALIKELRKYSLREIPWPFWRDA